MPEQAKPAARSENSGGHRGIVITAGRPRSKNTLKGFFCGTLPSGMVLHDPMLHEQGDARWIGLPGRPYTDASGKQTYARFMEFADRGTADRFCGAVLAALDAHLAEVAT